MDTYTRETKAWLEDRFRAVDESGVYIAHQPIYGFDKMPVEPGVIENYIRTYHIMEALSHIEFRSFLDVGGAEGYKSFIVADLFGAEVRSCDLSEQACKRAIEIFGVASDVADAHSLPYADNAFDVVLCSESLEHVTDLKGAARELLRVASKAVIITVPHEAEETVRQNLDEKIPHAHIHSLDTSSFDYLKPDGYAVLARRVVSPLLSLPSKLMPVRRQQYSERYPKVLFDAYNSLVPLLKKIFGKRAAGLLVRADALVCRLIPRYDAMIFVILKDRQAYKRRRTKKVSPVRIINYEVPHHYLK
jgi:ubiquinone/menaquinone biosynthesis C-methylase UbiE